jgi:hypothetical protein
VRLDKDGNVIPAKIMDNGGDIDDSEMQMPSSTAAANSAATANAIQAMTPDKKPKPTPTPMPQMTTGGAPLINSVLGTTPQASISTLPDQLPTAGTFDRGGEVNIHDGQHVPIIAQTGERVLSRKDNAMYKQGYRPIHIYDESQDVSALIPPTDQPTFVSEPKEKGTQTEAQPMRSDVQQDQLIPTEQPKGTPQEHAAIEVGRQKALGEPNPSASIFKLGLNRIHADNLMAPEHMNQGTQGDARGVEQGATTPSAMQPAAGPRGAGYAPIDLSGATGTPAQPQMIPPSPAAKVDPREAYKAKLASYDARIQDARDVGDETLADKLALAKNSLVQNTPWGSAASSHPGWGGKLLHGLARTGEVASDIFSPGLLQAVPGTPENRAARMAQGYQRIAMDTEAQKNEAEANAANNKEVAKPTYKEATQGGLVDPLHPELGPQQAYVNEKDPTDIKYSGKMPVKAEVEKDKPATDAQNADYKQRIANSGLTGNALSVYGTAPAGATPAELDKRFDEATKLRGMNQKDAETKIVDQARKDAAAEAKFQHDRTFTEKQKGQYYTYKDEQGKTQTVTGDKVPDGVETTPIGSAKDFATYMREAETGNIVQQSLNRIHEDVDKHPEIFDNAAARGILGNAVEDINRSSIGILVAGTGGSIPLPAGMGAAFTTALQNHTLDKNTADALKTYISDYKSMKDKVIIMQMEAQGGKIGRGNALAFKAIADQIPNGDTPNSTQAHRLLDNMQQMQSDLMQRYPDERGDYKKEQPYTSSAAPKEGDTQTHNGHTYKFDGKQYVKQAK